MALYLWWDNRRARKAWESRRPLYCWTPAGEDPLDPKATRFYTTRPPNWVRELSEDEKARLIEELDGG